MVLKLCKHCEEITLSSPAHPATIKLLSLSPCRNFAYLFPSPHSNLFYDYLSSSPYVSTKGTTALSSPSHLTYPLDWPRFFLGWLIRLFASSNSVVVTRTITKRMTTAKQRKPVCLTSTTHNTGNVAHRCCQMILEACQHEIPFPIGSRSLGSLRSAVCGRR